MTLGGGYWIFGKAAVRSLAKGTMWVTTINLNPISSSPCLVTRL